MKALTAFAEYVRSNGPPVLPQPANQRLGQAGDTAAPAPSPAAPAPPADPELVALEINADATTLLIGGELPLSVTGKLSNGSTQPFTDPVAWSTKPANVVRIDRKGVALGLPETVEDTKVTITATARSASGKSVAASQTITVTPGDHQEKLQVGVIDKDLGQLRADLESTSKQVEAAIAAEAAMTSAAAKAGIDLDKPDTALACLRGAMTDQQRNDLKNGAQIVEDERSAVVTSLQEIEITLDKCRTVSKRLQLQKLPSEFFEELDKDLNDSGTMLEHFWDLLGGLSVATGWMDIIHTVGASDLFKDHLKSLGDEVDDLNAKIGKVAETLNNLVDALVDEAKEELANLNLELEKRRAGCEKKTENFAQGMKNYGERLGQLAGAAACPPEVTATYLAVLEAGQRSENALAALITKTLARDRIPEQVKQLVPLGQLIFNAPAGDKSVVNSYLVYQKGSKQYRYFETVASLQNIVRLLRRVPLVYGTAKSTKDRFTKWNDALTH
jgi:hypothetical protein